jgi:hypothetical protein
MILFEAKKLLTEFRTLETVKFLSKVRPCRLRNIEPRSSYVELYRINLHPHKAPSNSHETAPQFGPRVPFLAHEQAISTSRLSIPAAVGGASSKLLIQMAIGVVC